MAEKGFILSAEEELKLREPIDEYIGKIQEQNRCFKIRWYRQS
mgnify:CR=1 FL=1